MLRVRRSGSGRQKDISEPQKEGESRGADHAVQQFSVYCLAIADIGFLLHAQNVVIDDRNIVGRPICGADFFRPAGGEKHEQLALRPIAIARLHDQILAPGG